MVLTGIIIGVVFFVLGVMIFISEFSETKRCTNEAIAVIVDVIKNEHWKHRNHGLSGYVTYYYPVIEFTARDKTYRVKTNFKATHPETYKQGATLNILYNPQNPSDLKLQKNSLKEGVIGMVFMFILGAVFAYIGIRAGLSK